MPDRMSTFEVVLLVVGIISAIIGFQLINQAYSAESGQLSWLMIIAIFSWLTLLVMFILLSLMVDVSKRELKEMRTLIELLSKKNRKK